MPLFSTPSHGKLAGPSAVPSGPATHRILLIAGIILGCWLLLPALTPTHVESFSARIESESIMHLRGQLALDEQQAYPVITKYLYGTRPGEIYVLSAFMKVLGTENELAFRALIFLSFAIVFVGSIVFCRRWSNEGLIKLIAAAILTQGLCETGFFFADNITSTAFFVLALCLVTASAPLWQWLLVGLLIGFAELVRIDVVVAVPGVFLLLFLLDLKPRKMIEAIACIALGAIAVLVVSFYVTGISLAASFHTAGSMAHAIDADFSHSLNAALNFFGLPGVLLFPLGLYRNIRTRSFKWNLALSAWPVVFLLLVFSKSTEVRHFIRSSLPTLCFTLPRESVIFSSFSPLPRVFRGEPCRQRSSSLRSCLSSRLGFAFLTVPGRSPADSGLRSFGDNGNAASTMTSQN